MNDLIIHVPEIIQAGGTIQAESIFDKIDTLASGAEETAKGFFASGSPRWTCSRMRSPIRSPAMRRS